MKNIIFVILILILSLPFVANAEIYTYEKQVDIKQLATEIDNEMGLKLIAINPGDATNGYISYIGTSLKIKFYESNEYQNAFVQPNITITNLSSAQENQLDLIVENHIP